ncbi:hypothetical protein [Pseudomonas sp. RIT-PI-S]|uniref:hypothetical protein n=1 Tax=Pseudomonas sp. RIT-PI-S TaxID=3035295 RepID=UPI0021D834C2|nr:hypothetical protein [Pseudomonas sp. RIT-PI-S]
MTNHHKPTYGPTDMEKSSQGARKLPPHADVKTDRAEKARIGGQHSHGGPSRRGEN